MRVVFRQAGGVAAPASNRDIEIADTGQLAPADRQRVESLVQEAELWGKSIKSQPTKPHELRNVFVQVQIADGNRQGSLEGGMVDVPATAAPLIKWLNDYWLRMHQAER